MPKVDNIVAANPLWGIAKTLVSELCPPKHEARGMGLTSGCWSLGLVVGPACGGLLASPATLYPRVFGSVEVLVKYPYLLPNLVTAAFGLMGLLLIGLFFPETLHNGTRDASPSPANPPPASSVSVGTDQTRGASMMELCRTPGVMSCLLAYLVISFNSIVFDEVVPLWSMASPRKGGLGLEQVSIGHMLTITGVALTLYTFTLYPMVANKLGDRLGFRVSMLVFGPITVAVTFLHSHHLGPSVRFTLLVVLYTIAKAATALGFSSMALMTNHCVGQEKRASLNGLTMTFGSIAKALGPLSGALVFAWSLNSPYSFPLDFHLIFLILMAMSGVAVVMHLPASTTQTQKPPGDIELAPHIVDAVDDPPEKAVRNNEAQSGYWNPFAFVVALFFGVRSSDNRYGSYVTLSTTPDDPNEEVL